MGEKDAKVTIMVLKVDLQCDKCYKKVKKLLCKYPQIRDQLFDDKQNTVTIRVVCCSPEKIRDKLCYKGGGSIKSIEIKEPPTKPKDAPAGGDGQKAKEGGDGQKAKGDGEKKAKGDGEKKAKEGGGEKKKDADGQKAKDGGGEKPKEGGGGGGGGKPKEGGGGGKPTGAENTVKATEPVQGYPSIFPAGAAVTTYYGYEGGPYYNGNGYGAYGAAPAPVIQYDGYYGRPVYDSWGGGGAYNYNYSQRSSYVRPCDYVNEENPQACTVM